MRRILLVLGGSCLVLSVCTPTWVAAVFAAPPVQTVAARTTYPQPKPVTGQPDEFPVRKTDAEWRRQLTPAQYHILRQQGTERPFTGQYSDHHAKGAYYCAADHHLLYRSSEKFESGTGWPSFWAPATEGSVKVKSDRSHGMSRDEIVCAGCGSHLGHVFDDGPRPTGQRYCMNSAALVFEKE